MGRFGVGCTRFCAAVFLIALTGVVKPAPAFSQTPSATAHSSLRAKQQTLFDTMRAKPQDLDAMFDYAEVSVQLQDYEAAISTLERMLIFNSNLPRVRLELGALYFNIGAYSLAEYYFLSVAGAGGVPEAVRGRIDKFLAEIAKRTRKHSFKGRIEAGIIYDSNANLGPADSNVLLFGRPAVLVSGSGGDEDAGGRVYAQITHRYAISGPTADYWQTDGSFFGRRYSEVDTGASDAFYIRTGPRLSLDDALYGPKLRPFIDVEYARADESKLYQGGGVGFEYTAVLSGAVSTFSTLRAGIRAHDSARSGEDGFLLSGRSGLAWKPAKDVTLTAAVSGLVDDAKSQSQSNDGGALRLTASYDYDPGLAPADRNWRLSAQASAAYRRYRAPDPVVSPTQARRDVELRLGVQNTFYFRDGFYASLGASGLVRESNLSNFDLSNVGLTAVIGIEF